MSDGFRPVIDRFTRGYIAAALWSSTAYGSAEEDAADPAGPDGQRRGTFDRSFLDLDYDTDHLSAELLAHICEDCAAFQRDNRADLDRAGSDDQNGHDFWLTRNGHGVGFWDRGYGAVGDTLSDAARAYGEENWYVDREAASEDDRGIIRGDF